MKKENLLTYVNFNRIKDENIKWEEFAGRLREENKILLDMVDVMLDELNLRMDICKLKKKLLKLVDELDKKDSKIS